MIPTLTDDPETLTDEELLELTNRVVSMTETDRKQNALHYYKPANETIAKIHDLTVGTIGIFGGNGCLPLTAPVLMADGTWKALADVAVGDRVMAADPVTGTAAPSSVVRTYRSGEQEVFRITYSDGEGFEATAEHEVPLRIGSGSLLKKYRIGDYLASIPRRTPAHRVSASSPRDLVYAQNEPLPIDPYLLGCLLGDGDLTGHGLKFFNTNAAVLARVADKAAEHGLSLVHYSGPDYGLTSSTRRPNALMSALRSLRLWGCDSYTKGVPRLYMTSSRQDRLHLVAGLVDTDGSVDEFVSVSKALAEGFVGLIRSIGGKAVLSAKDTTCQTGSYGTAYRVYWKLSEALPLACSYKQAISKNPLDYTRRICRKVESVGIVPTGDIQVDHPAHCYVTESYTIVGNSGKTEHALVEGIIRCTGQVPASLHETYPMGKLTGPIHMRVVCESLTTVLDPIILPKLQYFAWSGLLPQGGGQGHWGWIPKHCLIQGDWKKSYDKRLRILTLLYRNPHTGKAEGTSTIQFMSYDQDSSDFASGDLQYCLHDEPPTYEIWKENRARVMRGGKGSTLLISMTWPDNPASPVDWLFDEVYDKGTPGPEKDPDIEIINIFTTSNPHLDQDSVTKRAAQMSKLERNTRIYGLPIRFSNRIHPDFTDVVRHWCYECGAVCMVTTGNRCSECQGDNISEFCHVGPITVNRRYPIFNIIDPHPRKPHMLCWVQVTPNSDYEVIREVLVPGGAEDVRDAVTGIEAELQPLLVYRLMDPNMGASPSGAVREVTWQMEFDTVGLHFDLADDSDVGRARLNTLLKADPYFRRPRFRIDTGCTTSIFQMKRYVWADHAKVDGRDVKQKTLPKNDDFPTMFKYLMNRLPDSADIIEPVVYRKPRSEVGYRRTDGSS